MVNLNTKTALFKAIRKKCLDCCAWQPSEITKCNIPECALYPYRFGKVEDEIQTPKTT